MEFIEQASLNLFERETSLAFMDLESVSTVSYYEGDPSEDFLEDRILEILELNPWLAGSLETTKGKVSVQYSSTVLSSPCLNVVDGVEKDLEDLKKFCVKKGSQCVNSPEPLFKVTLLKLTKRFALIVSLSHVIGDGHTYYSIYKMLSLDSKPEILLAERDQELLLKMLEKTKHDEGFLQSFGLLVNFIGSAFFARKVSVNSYAVNQEWVQEQKQRTGLNEGVEETKGLASFISTNDILTSTFFAACKCDVGMMAVNFRGRVPGLKNCHAGNYEGFLNFTQESFLDPYKIRKSVTRLKTDEMSHSKDILPGFFKKARAKIGFITNWSGFYHELQLRNCELLYHRPIMCCEKVPLDVAIVYFEKKGKLAVMTLEDSDSIIKEMMLMKVVKDRII